MKDLIFEHGMAEASALEGALRLALENDEFALMFQPFINVETDVVQGYEALIRWGRPGQAVVPPAEFLPVAQASDIICEIDAWVLHAAIGYLARWQSEGVTNRILSINLGGRHVAQPRLLTDVKLALAEHKVDAERLLVEVAETVLADDPASRRHLESLRAIGVGVCLDDFGSGAQSAERLAELPVDIVKIDPSYLDLSNEASRQRFRDLVAVPQELGLPVVVEGVESDAQLAFVAEVGCEWAQGYHLAVPMMPMDVESAEVARLRR